MKVYKFEMPVVIYATKRITIRAMNERDAREQLEAGEWIDEVTDEDSQDYDCNDAEIYSEETIIELLEVRA